MADSMKFEEFCRFCDKISRADSKDNKVDLMTKFLSHCRDLETKAAEADKSKVKSIHPVFRLLLPKLDSERVYGVKEFTLAKTYIRILCLPKEGHDACKLIKFRAPTAGAAAGDFADVAYWVLKSRCRSGGQLSIAEVNKHLDNIVTLHASNKPRDVDEELTTMLLSMSAEEQKWLIRILLKDLRFGLGQNRIFYSFHPDAKDLYDVSNNLVKVCDLLHDRNKRLHEVEVAIFEPCRPMLADRCDVRNIDAVISKAPFHFIERKHDGERFQVHMKDGSFRYFSRNGYDYTEKYGATRSTGLLTPLLANQIKASVTSCILDGEMMGWNKKLECFGSKGMNYDVKNLSEKSVHCPCLCVFDILLLNGEVLTNKPLQDRLEILKSVFDPLEGVIMNTPQKCATSSSDVDSALNAAIDNREEGLILKDPLSVYKPNARKGGWIKIKPEYTAGLMTELDLLIIGGYYGKGRRRANISHFMLAVAVPPKCEGGSPTEFHSVGRVGSGYSVAELEELLDKLNPHWQRVQPGQLPPGILWTKDRPDVWIPPHQSSILQVKATEIVRTDQFQTGYTLRFPRVEKVRYDKPWSNCLTTEEFEELRTAASGKLAMRHVSSLDENDSSPKKRRKVTRPLVALGLDFQPADTTTITQTSSLLSGRELCVLSGNDKIKKQDLEKLIVQHGGSVVQHKGPETFCVIAGKQDVRFKNLSAQGEIDIATVEWLLNFLEGQGNLSWAPSDLLATSVNTRQKLEMEYDCFHDHYFHPATLESLKHSMEQVSAQGAALNLLPAEMASLDLELFGGCSPFSVLRCCVGYFVRPKVEDLVMDTDMHKELFRWLGGRISDNLDEDITHVIFNSHGGNELEDISVHGSSRHKFSVVSHHWVIDCFDNSSRLPESNYYPRFTLSHSLT